MTATLHDLLDDLLRMESSRSSLVEDFVRMDRIREELERSVAESRKRVDSYRAAARLLDHLVRSTSFNEELARMEYPSKVLKGPIDLGRSSQKEAVSELAITLDRDQRVSENHRKLLRALQMFYSEYFDQAGNPPREDALAGKKLGDFLADPKTGAREDYLQYRRFRELLAEADKDPGKIQSLPEQRPEFYADLQVHWLGICESQELKLHLLENTPWKAAHKPVLERIFCVESGPDILKACLRIMKRLGGAGEAFLDSQLGSEEKGMILTGFLQEYEPGKLKEMLRSSVRGGLNQLFSVLTHLVGYDPDYFYFSMKDNRISPEIFRKILDSLYIPFTPQESYGMDLQYADRILEKQRSIPQNVLRLLQKVMPRGLDSASLEGYFALVSGFNEEYRRLAEERAAYDSGRRPKDHSYMELMLRISAVESIRFVVFTYLYDRIRLCLKTSKKLEPEPERILGLLGDQDGFERSCGGNANIEAYIADLRRLFDEAGYGLRAAP